MENNEHNQALIDANRERLHVLQVQAATYGNDAPPHIITEISKIVATLRALQTVEDLTPTGTALEGNISHDQIERRRDASTNEQATLRMIATIQSTVSEVGNVKATLRDEVSNIHQQINAIRAEVKADIQGVHTTIDRVITNGLRVIGVGVLILGLIAIGIILYFRV